MKNCLKPHIDMNTNLRENAKNNFGKDFFKLYCKTMENSRKDCDFKLITKDERRSNLVSQPNYYT